MKAVLLCAGFATRMYPLTENFPKPLLEVAGRPLLDDLLEQLVGLERFDSICTVSNHRFIDHFESWTEAARARYPQIDFELIDDGAMDNDTRIGAVGDLGLALERIGASETTLVSAGDNLFRFDFEAFFSDYDENPRSLVLGYRERDPERLRRTGVAQLGAGGRLEAFVEKPAEPPSEIACPAFYLYGPSALARVPEFLRNGEERDAPGNLVAWLASREPVYVHEMRGARLDIGNLETYRNVDTWLARHPRR